VRSETSRIRRTSVIALSKELDNIKMPCGQVQQAPEEPKPPRSGTTNPFPSWGEWRGQNASNTVKMEDTTLDLTGTHSESELLDGNLLQELDAEMVRLERERRINIESGKVNSHTPDARQQDKADRQQIAMLRQMTEERDEARSRWKEGQLALEEAQKQLSEMAKAKQDAINASSHVLEKKEEASKTQKQALEKAEVAVARLHCERIQEDWKVAFETRCNHLDHLKTQSHLCLYFLTQLDAFECAVLMTDAR
jgi:hypothetical protein